MSLDEWPGATSLRNLVPFVTATCSYQICQVNIALAFLTPSWLCEFHLAIDGGQNSGCGSFAARQRRANTSRNRSCGCGVLSGPRLWALCSSKNSCTYARAEPVSIDRRSLPYSTLPRPCCLSFSMTDTALSSVSTQLRQVEKDLDLNDSAPPFVYCFRVTGPSIQQSFFLSKSSAKSLSALAPSP